MRRFRIKTVSRQIELQLAEWGKAGYEHPGTEQFKHGGCLNQIGDGTYTANIIGFVLVGKFGSPDIAFDKLQKAQGEYWKLLGLTLEQARPLTDFAGDQDCFDVGTETILHDLFDVEHFQARSCAQEGWKLNGELLYREAVVAVPVSDKAKQWLALAKEPENHELRKVRVNNLETNDEQVVEMRICNKENGELAIYVYCREVDAFHLKNRLWWLTRALNLTMPERIAAIARLRTA